MDLCRGPSIDCVPTKPLTRAPPPIRPSAGQVAAQGQLAQSHAITNVRRVQPLPEGCGAGEGSGSGGYRRTATPARDQGAAPTAPCKVSRRAGRMWALINS
jgi:hypothetical protein